MLDVTLLRYQFESERPLRLNLDLPSTTLRGAFGYALADLLARDDTLPDTRDRVALFRDLFTPDAPDAEPGRRTPPRPFVIRGGFPDDTGLTFVMELLLFGEAARFEALADHVVERIAERGLGGTPGRAEPCAVHKLENEKPTPAFPQNAWRLVVEFLSPTRIKHCKSWCFDDIPFAALAARLVDRYAELVRHYGRDDGRDWSAWSVELKRGARTIQSLPVAGDRFRGRRVSSRTGDSCALNGFVGAMLYQGDFAPYSEILGHLPFIHVGKSAPFGCGWTVVNCSSFDT